MSREVDAPQHYVHVTHCRARPCVVQLTKPKAILTQGLVLRCVNACCSAIERKDRTNPTIVFHRVAFMRVASHEFFLLETP